MESAGDNLWVQTESPLSALWQGQRDGDRCMSKDLRVTKEGCGGRRSGVPFPFCQRFQLSPSTLVTIYEHDLPTCAAPVLSPEPNLSQPPPPTTSNHSPKPPRLTLWPGASTVSPCKTINVICMFLNASTCARPRPQTGPPSVLIEGVSGDTSAQAQRWLVKKIQYSKCTGSPAYQYIIQKGDRWRAIRRWKAIEFSVSPYLHVHQSAAVDNWIKKETWWTSSSEEKKSWNCQAVQMPGDLDCLLWEQKLFVTSPQFSQLSSF